jgi:hypothetical protein
MVDEVDYLVVGSGASAMSFVDTMLAETDATFVMIDRRAVPGGHWNDSYPFVRLHQPANLYGVNSRPLGHDGIETSGLNEGFLDLASGVEITRYYHQLMNEVFLPSGRVRFYPLCEHVSGGEFVGLLSGEKHTVTIKKKLVDGTPLTTSIPLTHQRKFTIDDDIECVPPNDLPRLVSNHRHVTVLGGGKTAIDSVTWLLANGFPANAITWVMPRDSWFFNRASVQSGRQFLEVTMETIASRQELMATCTSADDFSLGMEQAGSFLRIDKAVMPTMFHGAIVTCKDISEMQRVTDVLRKGHVQHITIEKMCLTDGEVASLHDTLYVDCTASAVATNINSQIPVFSPGKIALQMIRLFQPCFSSALIAHIEATVDNEEDKQNYTRPTPMVDTITDWFREESKAMMNNFFWRQSPEISAWILSSRLDGFTALVTEAAPNSSALQAILTRLGESRLKAFENISILGKG